MVGKQQYWLGEIADKLWDCYKAPTKASFSQRLRRLEEGLQAKKSPDFMQERIERMRENKSAFTALTIIPKRTERVMRLIG